MRFHIKAGPMELTLLINGKQTHLDLKMQERNTLTIMTVRIVEDLSLSSNKKFLDRMTTNGKVIQIKMTYDLLNYMKPPTGIIQHGLIFELTRA